MDCAAVSDIYIYSQHRVSNALQSGNSHSGDMFSSGSDIQHADVHSPLNDGLVHISFKLPWHTMSWSAAKEGYS